MSSELHKRMDVSQLDCSSSEIVNASITHQINTVSILDNSSHSKSVTSAIAQAKYKKATNEFTSESKFFGLH